MGRGKDKKPADSSAEEPDKPPPVAPRPGASDSAFEQEKSSKKVEKSTKKDSEDLVTCPFSRCCAFTSHTTCRAERCATYSQEVQEQWRGYKGTGWEKD